MKKRLLFFFVGLVCSLVAMADNVGFTSTITGSSVSAPTVTTGDIEVKIVRGTQNTGTGKGSMFWGSTTSLTFAGTAERTKSKAGTVISAFDANCWTGASFKIPTGYTFDVTAMQVDIAGQDYEWGYKVELLDGDGTVVSTIDAAKGKPKASSKIQAKATGLSCSLSGTAIVKVYYYINGTSDSKYMAVPELYLTGTLTAATQTKYTKPSITQGAYDKVNGTYAVTLSTQNDEVGVINYTVDTFSKVTGAASGTIINVSPNSTVKATVSGSSFDESDEATLTIADAPKLAKPTYSIGAFNFETQQYEVTLAAPEGNIEYAIEGGAFNEYTGTLILNPGATIQAHAVQTYMTRSDVLVFVVPAAPKDGESATEKGYAYSDGMTYNAGAFTIPSTNSYIGGSVNSGNSSISGCIKMRMSRECDPADPKGRGFHILVNPGYVLKNVKLQILNNYTGDKANANLAAVYVDGVNELAAPVLLPKATGNTVQPAVVELNNIYATSKVVFLFTKVAEGDDDPNQAQVLISADALVPVYNTNVTADKFGTVYYAKELVCPEGTKAYTGEVCYGINDEISLKLIELTGGNIPANTPAIIAGNGGLFTVGTTNATFSGVNDLQGTLEEIATPHEFTVCVLGYEDGKSGFYRFDGPTLAANKAYLLLAAAPPAKINIVMDGEATGINTVNAKAKNGVMYNLAGQRVNANAKGLVIVNGKVVNMK